MRNPSARWTSSPWRRSLLVMATQGARSRRWAIAFAESGNRGQRPTFSPIFLACAASSPSTFTRLRMVMSRYGFHPAFSSAPWWSMMRSKSASLTTFPARAQSAMSPVFQSTTVPKTSNVNSRGVGGRLGTWGGTQPTRPSVFAGRRKRCGRRELNPHSQLGKLESYH
jgi:hypothetical protein